MQPRRCRMSNIIHIMLISREALEGKLLFMFLNCFSGHQEIANRKERRYYHSDWRSLECFKKGLKKYVNKKVKFGNASESTKVT